MTDRPGTEWSGLLLLGIWKLYKSPTKSFMDNQGVSFGTLSLTGWSQTEKKRTHKESNERFHEIIIHQGLVVILYVCLWEESSSRNKMTETL